MKTSTLLLSTTIIAFTSKATAFSPFPSLAKASKFFDEFPKNDFGKKAFVPIVSSILIFSNMLPGILPGGDAFAESRVVGEIAGSGIVFKDTLKIESFDDPKVKGVTLYISNFERPLNERLKKDFFSDPSFASVGCAKTGPVAIADNINESKQGEEVFEENRSLLFKQLRVQRVYDKEKNSVVYVSFNTRLDKGNDDNKSRYKSSICVVNLDDNALSVQKTLEK
mmetsp:Transcript_9925/g.14045  ORF Transcript_9925/g.14045 Transcript_9925/m.14045 type:complete len:224 (-) Transcript_9925:138-809(-)|eukprot:CAMPEP_0184865714 /NCGR_PEP_ID=MMETSP0580-20130426/18814_1 /TAXON_ID=1118495 /ORGANISM="Dactyliosolen fragilissimus" /LENGTH=223 /DNA_ID=CAMNT_0027365011 /DNA_START=45 /DNA_END=716 /DNA_ORIENTATION=-